jgi:hypothetical protein
MLRIFIYSLPKSFYTISLLLVLLFLSFVEEQPGLAAVDLLYFYATPEGDEILLEWETAQEIDNAGFYIQRRSDPADTFMRIGEFIPSQGDPFTGQYYFIQDDTAFLGILYYYRLEMIDASGNSEYSEPDSAQIPGSTPTASTTATRTTTATTIPTTQTAGDLTVTRTETPTVTQTPRKTRTNTPIPSITRSPTPRASATRTPSPSPTGPTPTHTLSTSDTPTPTTTLESLPTFIQAFPLPSLTATATRTDEVQSTPNPATELVQQNPLSIRLKILIAVVILLWIFLASFFVFYLRRLNSQM